MKVNEYIANVLSEHQNIFTVSGAGNLHILDEIKINFLSFPKTVTCKPHLEKIQVDRLT